LKKVEAEGSFEIHCLGMPAILRCAPAGLRKARLHNFAWFRAAPGAETLSHRRRWHRNAGSREIPMPDNGPSTGKLGAILGALIAVALAVFLISGGEYFGKKTINSDADLPPVATSKP
jgi:hypothetical protein